MDEENDREHEHRSMHAIHKYLENLNKTIIELNVLKNCRLFVF